MPISRTGMAVATYAEQIYVIGGETANGMTGVTERYDSATDAWTMLAPQPTPAADIRAAVVGGQIYVPGGLTGAGAVTSQLNIYDPRQNSWKQGEPMPQPRSAYALTAYEGKLYLFGGWDGHKFTDTVYEYSPDQDRWVTCRPMTTARGRLAAAAAGGRIYVIGGEAGEQPKQEVDSFSPGGDCTSTQWEAAPPLPASNVLDAISFGDILYALGQQQEKAQVLVLMPGAKDWQALPLQTNWITAEARMVGVEDKLHLLMGGREAEAPSNHWVYQVYYAVLVPLITK